MVNLENIPELVKDPTARSIIIKELGKQLFKGGPGSSLSHVLEVLSNRYDKVPLMLQAHLVLLRLAVAGRVLVDEKTVSYCVIRTNEEIWPGDLDDNLVVDYVEIMQLVKELCDCETSTPVIDTIMFRDMNLWLKDHYWEWVDEHLPGRAGGPRPVRRLFIYDKQWFERTWDQETQERSALEDDIRGFLYGILGHQRLGWRWSAVSRQLIESDNKFCVLRSAPKHNAGDTKQTIPEHYESSALLGSETVLYIYKYPDSVETRPHAKKYVLQFYRRTGADANDVAGEFRRRYLQLFKHKINNDPPDVGIRNIRELFQNCTSKPELKEWLKGADEQVNYLLQPTTPVELITEISLSTSMRSGSEGKDEKRALGVFCSYAGEDRELAEELKSHLADLRRQNIIAFWYDRDMTAGSSWREKIPDELERADIVLLLVSSDFMDSDYCYQTEMTRALIRHHKDEARVIPILLRPVDCESAPFADLTTLPDDRRAVTNWPNRDSAFAHIAEEIRKVCIQIRKPVQRPTFAGQRRREPST